MEVCGEKDLHPVHTARSRLTYCFTLKHHGAGSPSDSRWLPELSRDEKFGVFDMVDRLDLSDDEGNLHGIRVRTGGSRTEILPLGTRYELIARFWEQGVSHWHGHPLWPILQRGATNRSRQGYVPPRRVFERMVQANVLSAIQARRLKTGHHIRNL